jgi:hypothetical protein
MVTGGQRSCMSPVHRSVLIIDGAAMVLATIDGWRQQQVLGRLGTSCYTTYRQSMASAAVAAALSHAYSHLTCIYTAMNMHALMLKA